MHHGAFFRFKQKQAGEVKLANSRQRYRTD